MMHEGLYSDFLEQHFGPTGIEVLYQQDQTRIICTKASGSGQVLELSQVTFTGNGRAEFPDVQREVDGGKSMGQAFTEQGIAFERQLEFTGRYTLPDIFNRYFGVPEPATVMAVTIFVGPNSTKYAQILETYSSAVPWPKFAGEPDQELLTGIHSFAELLAGPS